MRLSLAWALLSILGPSSAVAEKVTLTFSGLSRELESAVRAGLGLSHYLERELTRGQMDRLLRTSDAEIRQALEPFGYYGATVTHDLERQPDRFHASFHVETGDRVLVAASNVRVAGSGSDTAGVTRALENFAPEIGSPLDHREYERSKKAVAEALADAGYLAASLRTHRVEVTRSTRTATIDLSWDSGERYRFGPIHFPATPLSIELLARMVPWKEGDYYSAEQLRELQNRLAEADYFAAAIVQPRFDDPHRDAVPVEVHLTPGRRDVRGYGIYGSTDTGAGVKAELQRRWLNPSGHKLQAEGEYAQKLQSATLRYRVPFAGPDERAISFGITYRDEITDSVQEETTKLAWNVSRKWRGYTRMLGAQLLSGDFELGSERGNSTELFAEAMLARTQSEDPAFPRRGHSLTGVARLAPSNVLSRTRFASAQGRAKWIFPSGEKSRTLLRADLAAMTVDDFGQLPPELRFFAGGDRSIRGFDYEALGSRNEAGDVIGGNFLAVVSAEYERYFGRKWGVATFVDAGDAFLNADFDWNTGVGIGARWKSPVGVVRLDIAYPVVTELEQAIRVHISIGPDL